MQTEVVTTTSAPPQKNFEERKAEFMKLFYTNPDLGHLAILPDIGQAKRDPRSIAHDLGLPADTVTKWISNLYEFGLWIKKETGDIHTVPFTWDNSEPDKLSLKTIRILSMLDPNGPCYYRLGTIATNEKLIRQLSKKVEAALTEFISESEKLETRDIIADFSLNVINVLESRKISIQKRLK